MSLSELIRCTVEFPLLFYDREQEILKTISSLFMAVSWTITLIIGFLIKQKTADHQIDIIKYKKFIYATIIIIPTVIYRYPILNKFN